jgi:hypothetical protein
MRSPLLEKIPTIIKIMVADDNMLYVGTSQGMVVAVPIDSLSKKDSSKPETAAAEGATLDATKDGTPGDQTNSATFLDNCALALHVQKDSRVKSLLHLQLPVQHHDRSVEDTDGSTSAQSTESHELQQTLPNVYPEGQESDIAAAALLSGGYRSLIVSAGKGHMEYSADKDAEDMLSLPPNYNSLREKNEEHQLLVWGLKL